MKKMSLKAVIFDMDGVLCATDEYHYQSWRKIVADYGIDFSREDNEKLLGLTRRRSLEVILNERQLTEQEIQDILTRKNQVFLELIEQLSPEDLLPGIPELLVELRSSHIKTAVASASRNTHPVLQNLGILREFDAIYDGHTVHRSKPAPDVFLETAKALRVQPEECLVLEDSEAGVQAGKTAGMCVVGVGPMERLPQAERVVTDLSEIKLEDLKHIYEDWRNRNTRGK